MSSQVAEKQVSGHVAPSRKPEPCPSCGRSLPVRASRAGEPTVHWECTSCNSPLTGLLVKEAAETLAHHVRISQAHFETREAAPIPAGLRQLVQEFATRRQKKQPAHERRQSPRVASQLDITIVPLDEHWSPASKPLLGVVVDLSANGLGIVAATKFEATHVAVQIRYPAGLVQLIGQIVWSNHLGQEFYNAGIQFVVRLGRSAVG